MNLPSDTPRLPKWIFFVGALVLLGLAWAIHDNAEHPWAPGPLVSAVLCVAVACVLNVIPFASDYARKQDEALDNRQRALQALAATVTSSAEQIAIATGGLQKLTGIAQENASQSEGAARQIQERISELRSLLAETRKGDDGAAAKLDAVAKKDRQGRRRPGSRGHPRRGRRQGGRGTRSRGRFVPGSRRCGGDAQGRPRSC